MSKIKELRNVILKPENPNTNYLVLFINILLFLECITFASDFLQLKLLYGILKDHYITEAMINVNDIRQMMLSVLFFACYLLVFFHIIKWMYGAYKKLEYQKGYAEYNVNWTIWGWFVPIMSLFRPYQMLREIIQSHENSYQKNRNILVIFWILWLLNSYLNSFIFQTILTKPDTNQLILSTTISMFSSFVMIPCFILLRNIIMNHEDEELASLHLPTLESPPTQI